MATLTGQTIASSYEQLLSLPNNGGNGATPVAVTDGDAGTTFAMQVSTTTICIDNPTTSSATQGGVLRLQSDDGDVMASGHRLGVIEFAGAEDDGNTITTGARIEALADATWSASENGADLLFYTTDGNASQSEGMRLGADRKLYFYDKGGEHISGDGTDLTIASGAYVNVTGTGLSFTSQATKVSLNNGNNAALTIEDGEGGNAMLVFDTNGGVGSVADVLVGASGGSAGEYSLSPAADNLFDLGGASNQWRNVYTGDLHLNNTRGDGNEVDGTTGSWTIQEGDNNLFLLNRTTGKQYKFNLEEIG